MDLEEKGFDPLDVGAETLDRKVNIFLLDGFQDFEVLSNSCLHSALDLGRRNHQDPLRVPDVAVKLPELPVIACSNNVVMELDIELDKFPVISSLLQFSKGIPVRLHRELAQIVVCRPQGMGFKHLPQIQNVADIPHFKRDDLIARTGSHPDQVVLGQLV